MTSDIDIINQDDGFTLLEVLVSFVILSLSLGIIYQILGSGTIATLTADNQAQAILIAKSKMSEALLYPGVREGEIGKFHWVSDVSDINEGQETTLRLLKVKVQVSWDAFAGKRDVSFETLRLLPELRS